MQTVTLQHNNATKLQATVASRWRARYAKLGGGTGCCTGGPRTAAADGPGGPNFAGDHVRRDRTKQVRGDQQCWSGGPFLSVRNGPIEPKVVLPLHGYVVERSGERTSLALYSVTCTARVDDP